MRFHREGWPTLFIAMAFSAIVVFCAHYFFPLSVPAQWFSYFVAAFVMLIVLQFFRDPVRPFSADHTRIMAPADGKVVVVEETTEHEYFNDRRLQVSIFMSPVNVHVNRYPIAGKVVYFRYHAGKFLAAWEPKSSTDNERTTVVIRHAGGVEVLFRQIAGALARRIVWYCKEGDEAQQNGEMGFIKFGSRVDLFLPIGTKLNVKPGDVVRTGSSVIGEI